MEKICQVCGERMILVHSRLQGVKSTAGTQPTGSINFDGSVNVFRTTARSCYWECPRCGKRLPS